MILKAKKILNVLFWTACCLFLVWCCISYIDVIGNNSTSRVFAAWNIFEQLFWAALPFCPAQRGAASVSQCQAACADAVQPQSCCALQPWLKPVCASPRPLKATGCLRSVPAAKSQPRPGNTMTALQPWSCYALQPRLKASHSQPMLSRYLSGKIQRTMSAVLLQLLLIDVILQRIHHALKRRRNIADDNHSLTKSECDRQFVESFPRRLAYVIAHAAIYLMVHICE